MRLRASSARPALPTCLAVARRFSKAPEEAKRPLDETAQRQLGVGARPMLDGYLERRCRRARDEVRLERVATSAGLYEDARHLRAQRAEVRRNCCAQPRVVLDQAHAPQDSRRLSG